MFWSIMDGGDVVSLKDFIMMCVPSDWNQSKRARSIQPEGTTSHVVTTNFFKQTCKNRSFRSTSSLQSFVYPSLQKCSHNLELLLLGSGAREFVSFFLVHHFGRLTSIFAKFGQTTHRNIHVSIKYDSCLQLREFLGEGSELDP
jgi:hypothetical protein